MKSFLSIIAMLLFFCSVAWGQDLRGIITDAKQRPLKGIKIWKKNTTESVKTDKTGLFIFPKVIETDTLIISVSRKKEAIIPVDTLTRFLLKIDKKDYVLYAWGKETKMTYVRKSRPQANSNVLTREQIQNISANTLYDLFKGGAIPGVTVNGDVITIRGGSSFDLDNEPLFVIDGTIYESSREADSVISVNDIEKVEILKDASMYGVRGSNGAIVITTVGK